MWRAKPWRACLLAAGVASGCLGLTLPLACVCALWLIRLQLAQLGVPTRTRGVAFLYCSARAVGWLGLPPLAAWLVIGEPGSGVPVGWAFAAAACAAALWSWAGLALVRVPYVLLASDTSLALACSSSAQSSAGTAWYRLWTWHLLARWALWLLGAAGVVAMAQGAAAWVLGATGVLWVCAWPLGQGSLTLRLGRAALVAPCEDSRPWLWWLTVWVPPIAVLFCLSGLGVPCGLTAGPLPTAGGVFHSRPGTYAVVGADFQVDLGATGVRIVTADGGGAGTLPLPDRSVVTGVRVQGGSGPVGVEVQLGNRALHTYLDPSGVRLGDGLQARLLERVPAWAWLVMAGCLWLVTPLHWWRVRLHGRRRALADCMLLLLLGWLAGWALCAAAWG